MLLRNMAGAAAIGGQPLRGLATSVCRGGAGLAAGVLAALQSAIAQRPVVRAG